MKPESDFSALRNLIALKKLETPLETHVDRFLIELHRRQRATLLMPESRAHRLLGWLGGWMENLRPAPSLIGVGAAAAIAIAVVLGFAPGSPDAPADNTPQLALRMPSSEAAFALVPAAFAKAPADSLSKSDSYSFAPAAKPSATRFILSSPRVAYDATAAF
jgi:hypothetical protein